MGFSSPAYFSQSFRRFTGQSPLEYRRKTSLEKVNPKPYKSKHRRSGWKGGEISPLIFFYLRATT